MNTRKSHPRKLLYSLFVFQVLTGCGDHLAYSLGATPGGVQDINFARKVVEAGQVPSPEAFFVEGMFSEHDLPLKGEACETTLCLQAASGIAPNHTGKEAGWLQIGLSSNIVPDEFEHPSQTIIAVVDISCSMGWTYQEGQSQEQAMTPGQVTRRLLTEIATRLRPQDNLAIVTYGSRVRTELDITSGREQDEIQEAIEELEDGGSTNMEAGLEEAYELAGEAQTNTKNTRLMLFTDVQPNVGATDSSSFRDMVKQGAEKDISLTVIGAGIGLGAELFGAMADLKGGNAFSVSTGNDVQNLMNESWPWMLVPIASDLEITLDTPASLRLDASYGFPSGVEEQGPLLKVSTVFLSRKRGALLLQMSETNEQLRGQTVNARLQYQDYSQITRSETLDVSFPTSTSTNAAYVFEQTSVGKATALALLVSGMKEATTLYESDRPAAAKLFRPMVNRIESDAQFFEDEDLKREAKFARDLLNLMEEEAPQGSFYGRF